MANLLISMSQRRSGQQMMRSICLSIAANSEKHWTLSLMSALLRSLLFSHIKLCFDWTVVQKWADNRVVGYSDAMNHWYHWSLSALSLLSSQSWVESDINLATKLLKSGRQTRHRLQSILESQTMHDNRRQQKTSENKESIIVRTVGTQTHC